MLFAVLKDSSFLFHGRVAQHSDSNKMDAHNLAVVFGPTLLRIPSEQDMIAYQSQVNGMIELLIKHCDEVFPGSGETLRAQLSETEESDSEEGKGSGINVSILATAHLPLP